MSEGKPDYLARAIKNIDRREKWIDIGVAYKNKEGSITIYLAALPLNDKIILIPTNKDG